MKGPFGSPAGIRSKPMTSGAKSEGLNRNAGPDSTSSWLIFRGARQLISRENLSKRGCPARQEIPPRGREVRKRPLRALTRAAGCHFNIAQQMTFQPCADMTDHRSGLSGRVRRRVPRARSAQHWQPPSSGLKRRSAQTSPQRKTPARLASGTVPGDGDDKTPN